MKPSTIRTLLLILTFASTSTAAICQAAIPNAKAADAPATLGTKWTLHYADGATEVLTIQHADPGQDPDFSSNRGGTAKVMINGGNKVMIIANNCILSGTIVDNQVKDGKVMAGDCPHPGAWTAQKK
jgi:hypothetical protein